jgi:type I restriction enzyme M protein
LPAHPLIKGKVEVMRPEAGKIIYGPACGTGGFLLGAYNYITNNYHPDKEQTRFLKFNAFKVKDIDDPVSRVCVINMNLQGIGGADRL